MKKRDYVYIGIILVGLISHFMIVENVKHESEWCNTLFNEFRKGL